MRESKKNGSRETTDFPVGPNGVEHGEDSSPDLPTPPVPLMNANKRRKEEAVKISQLQQAYGNDVEFILFLCGNFDRGYLGYEAAEGIDWMWEHRITDRDQLGISP
jgi:hypothetical protein